MGYTTPTTRSNGEFIDAADWNTDLTDNITFLANPPACKAYNTTGQSIPNNTDTAITFDSERYDTSSMHSTSSLTSRITVPIAGLYVLTGNVAFASNATGFRVAFFMLNGGTNCGLDIRPAANGDITSFSIATTMKLAANDYIELWGKQTSGGALSLNAGVGPFSPELAVTWVGRG